MKRSRRWVSKRSTSQPSVSARGMWTWFHGPRAIRHRDHTYVVWHHEAQIMVGSYRHTDGHWERASIAEVTANDHDVGSLGIDHDGRLIVIYSGHNQPLRIRKALSPESVMDWGDETIIDRGACTYPMLEYLANEDRWYLFYRRKEDPMDPQYRKHMPLRYRTSGDGGVSWSDETTLFDVPGHRPYVRVISDGEQRIDVACTDGHPGEMQENSIYHFFYDGAWRNSAGEAMGAPRFTVSDVTKVHDGAQRPAWMWDIAPGPVLVFATFPDAGDHRYCYASYDGTWNVSEIAAGGSSVASDGTEPHYSAGVALDPHDPSRVVYATGGSTRSQVYLGQVLQGRVRSPQRISRKGSPGEEQVRPIFVRGDTRVLWWKGRYSGYKDFDATLQSWPQW